MMDVVQKHSNSEIYRVSPTLLSCRETAVQRGKLITKAKRKRNADNLKRN
jgi:hypothetical protein